MTANATHPVQPTIQDLPPLDLDSARPSPVEVDPATERLDPMPLDPRFLPFHLNPRGGFLPLAPSRRRN